MRQTIKNVLFSAAFIAGLIVLLVAASQVTMPKGNAAEDNMFDVRASGIDAEPAGTIDMIIAGDSEAYSDFVPLALWKDFGCTSYLCSTSAQKMYETEAWIKRACRNQQPKVVLLESNVLLRPTPYEEAALAPIKSLLPVLSYHTRWKYLRPRDWYTVPEYTHIEQDKGYVYSVLIDGVTEDVSDYMHPSDEVERVSRLNLSYLDSILRYCDSRGMRLVLVSAPSTDLWSSRNHNAIARIAEKLGLTYIDLNTMPEETGIDWTRDTRDHGNHLNNAGALKATRVVGEILASMELLPDHRGDPAYAQWDEALADAMAQGQTFDPATALDAAVEAAPDETDGIGDDDEN